MSTVVSAEDIEAMPVPTLYEEDTAMMTLFTDVDEYTSYYDSIVWMYDNEVIEGVGNGAFLPDKCVNRAEFLKMLFEVLEIDENGYEAEKFDDVEAGLWYSNYIDAGRARGTIEGYPDNTFKAGQCVNRAEAVKMAVLEFHGGMIPENDLYYYDEYEDISEEDWFYEYLTYALTANVLGVEHASYDAFLPAEEMSRKEVAELLYRLKVLVDNDVDSYYSWREPFDIGAVPFYEACEMPEDVDTSGSDLMDAIPEDMDIVMSVDYTDAGDRDEFMAMLDKFPDYGLWEEFMAEFEGEDFEGLDTVLKGEWEVVFGMKFPEDVEDIMMMDEDEMSIYVVFRVEEEGIFNDFLMEELWQEFKSDMECSVTEDVMYWSAEEDDMYWAKYGDVYILTNGFWETDTAVEDLMTGDGFDVPADAEDSMFYMYMNYGLFAEMFDDVFEMMMGSSYDLIEALEELSMWLEFEDNGVSFVSEIELESGSEMIEMYSEGLSIIDKVPAAGVIAYVEDPNFDTMLSSIAGNFFMNDMMYGSELGLIPDLESGYTDLYDELVNDLDVSMEELESFLKSRYAVSISDVGQVYPGMVFYMELEGDDVGVGHKLADLVEAELDDFVANYDTGYERVYFPDVMVKHSNGSGLRSMILELDELEDEFWKFDVTQEDRELLTELILEVYYGVNNDDMFIFAIYPSFPDRYGNHVLKYSTGYKDAVAELDGAYGANVSYVDVDSLMDFVDVWVEMGDLSESDMEEYNMVRDFVDTIGFIISSGKIDGETMHSRMFTEIE